MKSRKEANDLRDNIQKELGLDLTKYRDEEVGGNLLDLMLFPKSLLKWILIPVLFCILLFAVGFFVIDLVHIQYLLYGTIGLILFLILGFFLGIMNVGKQLKEDLTSITDYSLGVMKSSLIDMKGLGDKVNAENRKDVLSMLFKGVILLVTVPMLKTAIDKKIPVGKPIMKRLLGGSLVLLANRIQFDPDAVDEHAISIDDEDKKLPATVHSIERAKGNVSKLIQKVLGIASKPFKLGFYVILLILLVFIWLLW